MITVAQDDSLSDNQRPEPGDGEGTSEERVQELVRQLAEVEAQLALASAMGGIDSVIDPATITPILLRQAQLDLASSEARFDRLVKAMSAIVFEMSPDGQVLFVNDAITPITGYEPAELQGKQAWEILWPGDLRPQVEELSRRLGKGNVARYEIVTATKDGRRHVLELNSANHYLPDGKLDRIVGIATDITERKRAAAALQQQAERLQLLNEIDRAILATSSVAAIASAALDGLRRLVACDRASVLVYNEDSGYATVVAHSQEGVPGWPAGTQIPLENLRIPERHRRGEAYLTDDLQVTDKGEPIPEILLGKDIHAFLSLPLMAGDRLIGSMNISDAKPGAFTSETIAIIRPVSFSLAVAIHNARLFESVRASQAQLQAYSRRLVEAVETERRTIGRELHDEAGQALTALKLGLGRLRRAMDLPADYAGQIEELLQIADGVMGELHRLALNLRPVSLDRYGLAPALEQYIEAFRRKTGLEVDFVTLGIEQQRLPAEVETALYRITQEALTNAARHAHAKRVGVILERLEGRAAAIIEDDGLGFDVQEALLSDRLGLLGMRERAEMLGGSLTIESRLGNGTTVFAVVPCGN